MNKQKLLEQSELFQKQADEWLISTGLEEFLSQYGEFHLEGSYCYGLMTEGDIDMYVLVNDDFDRTRSLEIYKEMLDRIPGIAGYKYHDYVNLERPVEYPEGYKISLFAVHKKTKWRFDIWFWTKDQFLQIEDYPGLIKQKLNAESKLKILGFKDYLRNAKISVPSVKVYDAVLKENILTIEELRKYLKK